MKPVYRHSTINVGQRKYQSHCLVVHIWIKWRMAAIQVFRPQTLEWYLQMKRRRTLVPSMESWPFLFLMCFLEAHRSRVHWSLYMPLACQAHLPEICNWLVNESNMISIIGSFHANTATICKYCLEWSIKTIHCEQSSSYHIKYQMYQCLEQRTDYKEEIS